MSEFTVIVSILGVLVLLVIVWAFRSSGGEPITKEQVSVEMKNVEIDDFEITKSSDSYGTSLSADFESNIPKGEQILFNIRDIVLSYNLSSAKKFLKSEDFTLVLLPEPNNENDKNAIAIYSNSGKLGYIPRDIAPVLHQNEWLKKIGIRLRHVWVGEKKGTMDLQLLAPKKDVKEYKDSK